MVDQFNGVPPLGTSVSVTEGEVQAEKPVKQYNFPASAIGTAGTDTTPPVYPATGHDGGTYHRSTATAHYFNKGKNFVMVDGSVPFKMSDYEVEPVPLPATPPPDNVPLDLLAATPGAEADLAAAQADRLGEPTAAPVDDQSTVTPRRRS